MSRDLVARIQRFVTDPVPSRDGAGESFERLALDTFAFQYGNVEPYRRLCDLRQAHPGSVTDWRDIPAVPVLAFKTLELVAAPAVEIFRSSGTLGDRSVHRHPFPDLYRHIVSATFPGFCLPRRDGTPVERPPMLALVPSRKQMDDSSLGFMVDHILRSFGGERSRYAFGDAGVEVDVADAWVESCHVEGRPALVLATSFALAQWLDALGNAGRRHRLPEGSVVFDTGGFKGRHRELTREELLRAIEDHLGVPAHRVVREYGMTELTSQFYTDTLGGGDGATFVGPSWLRARILDPESLVEKDPGEVGIVAVFDLGNVGSVAHLLTQDLGVASGDGFQLLGRASEAELRGCSLTVEELTSRG